MHWPVALASEALGRVAGLWTWTPGRELEYRMLVENLSPWIVDPECTRWEVAERIGLGRYELVRREYGYRPTRVDSIRSALGK